MIFSIRAENQSIDRNNLLNNTGYCSRTVVYHHYFGVGWVEQRDTQHLEILSMLGIALLHPTYEFILS